MHLIQKYDTLQTSKLFKALNSLGGLITSNRYYSSADEVGSPSARHLQVTIQIAISGSVDHNNILVLTKGQWKTILSDALKAHPALLKGTFTIAPTPITLSKILVGLDSVPTSGYLLNATYSFSGDQIAPMGIYVFKESPSIVNAVGSYPISSIIAVKTMKAVGVSVGYKTKKKIN
jgi:hypothetical protein